MKRDQIVLITGGTAGIGKATATGIAQTGATVIIVGRDKNKAFWAADDIKRQSSNPNVIPVAADLSARDEIDRIVAFVKSDYGYLDVLINNIGFISSTRQITPDGYEKVFFLNYLLPFYLTYHLLPLLQSADAGRVVNVTGGAYAIGKINFEDLQAEHGYKAFRALAQAKLALVQFSLKLAKRLKANNISVFVSDPGTSRSGMGPENPVWPWFFRFVLMPLAATSPDKAAKSSIYAATSDALKGETGTIINAKCKAVKPAKAAGNEAIRSMLWLESENLLGIRYDRQIKTGISNEILENVN